MTIISGRIDGKDRWVRAMEIACSRARDVVEALTPMEQARALVDLEAQLKHVDATCITAVCEGPSSPRGGASP